MPASPFARFFVVEVEEMALGYLWAQRDRRFANKDVPVFAIARRLGILLPSPDRFWSWVAQGQTDDCMEWMGQRLPKGYGTLAINSVRTYAHRVAYSLAFGPIPDGFQVCHRCDNPPCCNPTHLFLGTALDNARDRVAKGRSRNGPNAPGRQRTAA